MLKLWAAIGLTIIVCLPTATAHHSFAAQFDNTLKGELEGTIVRVWFRNPHVRYRIEIRAADGSSEQWELQTSNIASLRRVGWGKESLSVGERVRVWGVLGRNEKNMLAVQGIEKGDGTELIPPGLALTINDPKDLNAKPDKVYGYGGFNKGRAIDITGLWSNWYKFRLTVDDLEPKPTPYTDAGKRFHDASEFWHDDALRCVPYGLPRAFGSPYAMEILDAGSHYLVVYEDHNMPRRIWMDGRRPQKQAVATSMGFSVGQWENDTLVIETTHLLPGTLDGTLMPMSGEGTRLVENWTISKNRLSMDRKMTIYDPFYTEPLVRQRGSARDDSIEVVEQAACDPDSHYRDLLEAGRLQDYFER